MKCSNCQDDVGDTVKICPHCSADIVAQPEESTSPGADPGPEAVPTPDIDIEPEVEIAEEGGDGIAGAMADLKQKIEDKSPEGIKKEAEVSATVTIEKHEKKAQVRYLVIAIACFGAFKLGLFNNLLYITGLKAEPELAVVVEASEIEEDENDDMEMEELSSNPEGKSEEVVLPEVAALIKEPEVEKAPIVEEILVEPEEWWFYGKVYDLMTLRRVAGVEMYFFGADGDITAKTNAKGEYKVKLPLLDGAYEMIIDRAGYSEGYLVDGKRVYRNLPESERSKIWGTVPKKTKWQGTQAQWKRMDLVVFPLAFGD